MLTIHLGNEPIQLGLVQEHVRLQLLHSNQLLMMASTPAASLALAVAVAVAVSVVGRFMVLFPQHASVHNCKSSLSQGNLYQGTTIPI